MTAIYLSFTLAMVALTLVRWRWAKAILFAGIVASAPIIYFDTLSHPKLLTDELVRDDEQVRIIGYTFIEGVAVYYWLDLPGRESPAYYYEPWSEEARKRVEKMIEGSEKKQGMLFINPFEHSWEKDKPKTVHPLPQPKLPEKQAPPATREFDA